MSSPLEILKGYWGYASFRGIQGDVINEILSGKDVLAIMPTGGGKSLCYQVPAMASDGICLVISPLIALMQDQADQLRKLQIKTAVVHSQLRKTDIDRILDNCIYGNYKFLFVAPERVKQHLFVERVKKMKVNLVAIDEAHCISQWGHDFRPAYLELAALKGLTANAPFIALTASATGKTKQDILAKLEIPSAVQLADNFDRPNLRYNATPVGDKRTRLLNVLREGEGSAIIYVNRRRHTKDLHEFLAHKGLSSTFYHGGMEFEAREKAQNSWVKNDIRIMIATNAFGMGINKPDVRHVIHWNLPDSIESYYQEAGRAGRDGKTAAATIIYDDADIHEAEHQLQRSFPSLESVQKHYQQLANYHQLPIGYGELEAFPFNISNYCERFGNPILEAYSVLKTLELEGYIKLNEGLRSPSQIQILMSNEALTEFREANGAYELLLNTLLRSHGGLFDQQVSINEFSLAQNASMSRDAVVNMLLKLDTMEVLKYTANSTEPFLTYTKPRVPAEHIQFTKARYHSRKETKTAQLNSMLSFISEENDCRAAFITNYFGETSSGKCGVCDNCMKKTESTSTRALTSQILDKCSQNPTTIDALCMELNGSSPEIIESVRWLVDSGKLMVNQNKYSAS